MIALLRGSLIEKHPLSYRKYLPTFLSETEQEAGALLAHIHQLETERYEWLGPELMSLKDDVAVLEAKVARQRERQEAEAERARLQSDRDRLAAERAAAESTARELSIALDRANAEVDALRRSASWRVTRPLRSIYGWMMRFRRPRGGAS